MPQKAWLPSFQIIVKVLSIKYYSSPTEQKLSKNSLSLD